MVNPFGIVEINNTKESQMEWKKPKVDYDPSKDLKGTQLGGLLEGLQGLQSMMEAQVKAYEVEMKKATLELAKYEAQARSRKDGR